jgi:hypothetical protein
MRGKKLVVFVAMFFGFGFMAGFFTGFNYNRFQPILPNTLAAREGKREARLAAASSEDEAPKGDVPIDSELVLEEHGIGEDENGIFISGTIYNRSPHGYDAVRVTFDLCDESGGAYSGITDITRDRMEPGDSWGFTIYIPYSEMDVFSSYKLHSIMGTTIK